MRTGGTVGWQYPNLVHWLKTIKNIPWHIRTREY